MGLTETLGRLPHPPVSWLFQPARLIPLGLRNKSLGMALNKAFHEPLAEGDFDALDENWLHIHVSDLDLDFYLTVVNDTIELSDPRPCDVTIGGNSTDFLALAARREDPDTLFFNRRITIEGDTELGLGVKNMLDALEYDQLPNALQWTIKTLDSLNQS